MATLAGIFLIAHGLMHLAVWLPTPTVAAPFDPGRSWMLGEARAAARMLALVACAALVTSGTLVLPGAGEGAVVAVAGAAVSLALITLTFNRWLAGAVAINVGIVLVAIA